MPPSDALPHANGIQWDPHQYRKFAHHRLRPALELLSRIPLPSPRVICDLGCGSGTVTRLLAERWPRAKVYGIDNSPQMLAQARGCATGIHWLEADIASWSPPVRPDLVYSNAALHWVDNHAQLFPRLFGMLPSGGCLAVQMPLSWSAPSHRLMRETLMDGGTMGSALGSDALRRSISRNWTESAGTYYDLLAEASEHLDIWETEYLQVLEGENPVLEWVKGTGLRPILEGLDDRDREIFLQSYSARLQQAYPARPDGRTLYPFRRLFLVAVRA
ncbi:MAG: methyltransferase domain-containing protein [Gammaproteobacteria bacterium]